MLVSRAVMLEGRRVGLEAHLRAVLEAVVQARALPALELTAQFLDDLYLRLRLCS
jgi:hypothetical protein